MRQGIAAAAFLSFILFGFMPGAGHNPIVTSLALISLGIFLAMLAFEAALVVRRLFGRSAR